MKVAFTQAKNVCEFCRNSEANDVASIKLLEPKIRKILDIQLNDEDENATVCSVCTVTLNYMEAKRQSMRANFYKKKADSSYIKGDGIMAKMYLSQSSKEPTLNKGVTSGIINTNGNGLKIAEVRSQVEFSTSCDENCCDDRSDPTTEVESLADNQTSSNCLLLRPMNESKIARITKNSNHKPSIMLSCNECLKNFKTEHYYNKHKTLHRRRKSLIESTRIRKYGCNECSLVFNSIGEVRIHKLSHKRVMRCKKCDQVFLAKMELDWHEVECEAKHEAESPDAVLQPVTKRRTRSETRIIKELKSRKSECSMDDEATSIVSSCVDSTYTGRNKLVEKFINERSNVPQEPPPPEHNINYENEDSDHGSVITNFTSVSQRAHKKELQYCIIDPNSDLIVPFVYVNRFKCHDCRSSYDNITDMMKHEIRKHYLNARFTCYQCYSTFTRQNYLEMHELSHHPYFTCHQCLIVLPTRRSLHIHLNLHIHKSYECLKCSRSYLTVRELKEHSIYNKHENDLENIKIKRFIKPSNYYHRSTPSKCGYQAYDRIQPKLKKEQNRKMRIYAVYNPIKTKLYNGFYEKIQNIEPEQINTRNNGVLEDTIENPITSYQEEGNIDDLTEWNFDENFDFQLFSIENLKGPPSNESLISDFDFFKKLDPLYSSPKHILSYTKLMEEYENCYDF